MEKPLMYHEVEYLNSSLAENSITGEPIVIMTIRPDESFRPHNIGLTRPAAERILRDLQRLLMATPLLLLLLAGGCSADIEVESETTSTRPEGLTKERTAVAVDLLREQGPVVLEEGTPVPPDANVVIVHGCLHLSKHLTVYLNEGNQDAERIAVEIVRQWNAD